MSTILVNVLKPQTGNLMQVTGNLDVSGTLTAYKFETITVSNTTHEGATSWGNSNNDTHKFTGHVSGSGPAVLGSLILSGEGATNGNLDVSGALDVAGATTLDGAVTLGNAAADVVTSTGRLTGSQGAYFANKVRIAQGQSLILNGTTDTVKITNNGSNLDINSTNSIILNAGNQPSGIISSSARMVVADLTVAQQGAHAGNLLVSGSTTLASTLNVNGNTTLGNATSDYTMVTGSFKISGNIFQLNSSEDEGGAIYVINHHANASEASINLQKKSDSPANGDKVGLLAYIGQLNTKVPYEYANMEVEAKDVTNKLGIASFSVSDTRGGGGVDDDGLVAQYLRLDGNRRAVIVGPDTVMLQVSGAAGISGSLDVNTAIRVSGSNVTNKTALTVNADAVTSGKGVSISTDARTTGTALDISDTATNDNAGSLVKIVQAGSRAGSAASIGLELDFNTVANANARALKIDSEQSTGVVFELNADGVTTGTALDISADALTSGTALNINSTSNNTTGRYLAKFDNTTSQQAVPVRILQQHGTGSCMAVSGGVNGAAMGLRYKQVQQNVNTSGTTTTFSDFIPGNSLVICLQFRVTTAIGNNGYVTTIRDSEGGSANTYYQGGGDGEVEDAGGSFAVANATAGYVYHDTSDIVFTHNAQPNAGAIRLGVWYWSLTPPTS